jgi:hypothetical protein
VGGEEAADDDAQHEHCEIHAPAVPRRRVI